MKFYTELHSYAFLPSPLSCNTSKFCKHNNQTINFLLSIFLLQKTKKDKETHSLRFNILTTKRVFNWRYLLHVGVSVLWAYCCCCFPMIIRVLEWIGDWKNQNIASNKSEKPFQSEETTSLLDNICGVAFWTINRVFEKKIKAKL